ncbi:MAG: ABC transporter substrate-binding protein [Xanthobacteraceae bacterium]
MRRRARAQQPRPVIGFLSSGRSDDFNDVVATFRKGLAESGFVEGQNVVIEYRWADGQYERQPTLVADLVHHPVTVIFTNGGLLPARAAKAATETIPIVFEVGTDPVRLGLVTSLNRPGGNVTGVTLFSGVVLTKRLGLLRELAPNSTSIAMFVNPNNPNAEVDTKDVEAAARDLGLQLHVFHAVKDGDVDAAFASLIQHSDSCSSAPIRSSTPSAIALWSWPHNMPCPQSMRGVNLCTPGD